MKNISDILEQFAAKTATPSEKDSVEATVLADPKVQAFLKAHEKEISPEMLKASIFNLYLFVSESKQPKEDFQGYQPILEIGSDLIERGYTKTKEKRAADQRRAVEERIELVKVTDPKLLTVRLDDVANTPGRKLARAKIANFLKEFRNNPHAKGLYLEGNFGVGKTYMMAGLAHSVALLGKRVIFLHVPKFIADLSSHFDDHSLSSYIDKIAAVPVLIFDDIGAERLSDWSRDDVLGVILQQRMDNDLPTFFTSNLNFVDLEAHFAESRTQFDELKAKRLMERVRFLSKEVLVDDQNWRHNS